MARGVSCPNKIKLQWRIQDFPDGVWGGGAPTTELGAKGEVDGGHVPDTSLDPPMK